jgi:hypothetical protein
MAEPISIPALFFEARTLAVKSRRAEAEVLYLDAVLESLIAGDISEGEGWSTFSEVLARLKAAAEGEGGANG